MQIHAGLGRFKDRIHEDTLQRIPAVVNENITMPEHARIVPHEIMEPQGLSTAAELSGTLSDTIHTLKVALRAPAMLLDLKWNSGRRMVASFPTCGGHVCHRRPFFNAEPSGSSKHALSPQHILLLYTFCYDTHPPVVLCATVIADSDPAMVHAGTESLSGIDRMSCNNRGSIL